MNFNVYLDDALATQLARLAKRTGAARNALIRKAVASWVKRPGATWPASVLEWEGDPDLAPFEDARSELAPPSDDPFGSPKRRPTRRARGHAKPTRARRR